MNLNFKSVVTQNESDSVTEYTTTYEEELIDEFIVLKFKDNNQVGQEIWVSGDEVRIYFADQKIEMELQKPKEIMYKTEHGNIYLSWYLRKVKMDFDQIYFEYDLLDSTSSNGIIGTTAITLKTQNK